MRRVIPSIALALVAAGSLVALLSAQAPAPSTTARTIVFAKDVQPILEKNCLSCHGDSMQMSKLDLRTRESAMQGGAHGAVLLAGKADESKLYRMIAGLEKPAMPMPRTRHPPDEVATPNAWHDTGVQWETAPPRHVPLRAVVDPRLHRGDLLGRERRGLGKNRWFLETRHASGHPALVGARGRDVRPVPARF